jgi:hypothetical protein
MTKSKIKNAEPKKKLERLICIATFFICFLFLFVYQNIIGIRINLSDWKTLLQYPIITILIFPIILYTIIRSDPLQRGHYKTKSIKFFQNEFPSNYILERCNKCIENEGTCQNFIKKESYSHIRYWFRNIFHGKIEADNPDEIKNTFEKGYTCKLVYYFSWILITFFLFALLLITFHHTILLKEGKLRFSLNGLQVFFPIACLSLFFLIRFLNNPNEEKPTGCWQAWREVNRTHVSWLKENEPFLTNLICRANGGTHQFKEK